MKHQNKNLIESYFNATQPKLNTIICVISGDVPAAVSRNTAGVIQWPAAHQGGQPRRGRDGGTVRERAGDGLHAGGEQGPRPPQRPRRPPPPEATLRKGRLCQEEPLRLRSVCFVGWIQSH